MTDWRPEGGRLYVVAAPIGHWDDLSPRALKVLAGAALVAAEDTRYALNLLRQFGIKVAVVSCHQHNQTRRAREVIARLAGGEVVAYLSDAGTPGISDPGAGLVELVAAAGHPAIPIPGPSAVCAAISVAGFTGRGFHFLGFPPRTRGRQRSELAALERSRSPIVLFESPRRIRVLLETAVEALGDRPAMLGRELTKVHEEILRGRLSEILAALPEEPRGEMVLVISGRRSSETESP